MRISKEAKEIVGTWSQKQDRPLEILFSAADHPRSEPLREFCQWLAAECSQIKISETVSPEDDLPALKLRQGAIIYRAVPVGTELEPFLAALAGYSESTDTAYRTAVMRIHVASACPHCPAAVSALLPMIASGGPLTLEVIDSEACSDLAESDKVKSVPTLILDSTFRWTGSIRPEDLEAMLAPGDRVALNAGTLERLLENGNAGPLTQLVVDAGQISPAFSRLLAAEAMSVRLGAMMMIEELLERAPGLVEQLIPALQDQFTSAPEPAQGDMLYIFGEAGPPAMIQKIESFLGTGLHPEVEEAAREALEQLAERHGLDKQ